MTVTGTLWCNKYLLGACTFLLLLLISLLLPETFSTYRLPLKPQPKHHLHPKACFNCVSLLTPQSFHLLSPKYSTVSLRHSSSKHIPCYRWEIFVPFERPLLVTFAFMGDFLVGWFGFHSVLNLLAAQENLMLNLNQCSISSFPAPW